MNVQRCVPVPLSASVAVILVVIMSILQTNMPSCMHPPCLRRRIMADHMWAPTVQAQERAMAVKYEALKQRKLEELDALLREQADQV